MLISFTGCVKRIPVLNLDLDCRFIEKKMKECVFSNLWKRMLVTDTYIFCDVDCRDWRSVIDIVKADGV